MIFYLIIFILLIYLFIICVYNKDFDFDYVQRMNFLLLFLECKNEEKAPPFFFSFFFTLLISL